MKNVLLTLLFFPITLFCQIDVDKAGDDWDGEVYRALHLIYGVSPSHYLNIVENVDKVEFWNQNYSSNDGQGVIVIAADDIKLGSINNLAAVLVHESCHIMLSKTGIQMDKNAEEYNCYRYELEFLQLLPEVEEDLIKHAKQQLENYNKK